MRSDLGAERLREVLDYDAETGIFAWRNGAGRARAGDIAGSSTGDGRVAIRVDGGLYLAHRLAWLYVHGVWPHQGLDHLNGDPSDNSIDNLRLATPAENCQNQRGAHVDSRSGRLGVYRNSRGRWIAQICIGGQKTHLGSFPTPEAASVAYLEAKRERHPFATI